jgi:nickel/cobalt transporter (NicO) family protein
MLGELFRSGDGPLDGLLVRLIDDPAAGTVAIVLALLAALAVGAVHALGPGHGKTLVAAWLAGSGGRARDAVALGVLVALMHTGSVLLLGSALHATQQVPGGERSEPLLTLLSAIAVTAVGFTLLVGRLRARGQRPAEGTLARAGGAAETRNQSHHHHGHHHNHQHHHLPEGLAPLSRAGAIAIASTGGLLPSPAALLVLMTALALGQVTYGLVLIGAFSLGLAATLATIGLAVIWGGDRLRDRAEGSARLGAVAALLPIGGAAIVALGGLVLTVAAVGRL